MALPSGYKRLQYIKSNGDAYINTKYNANANTKIVLDCEITYASAWIMILGSYDAGSYFSWWADGSNALRPYYGSSNATLTGQTGRIKLTADKNVWSVNDNSHTFTAATISASSPIYIGSINNGGDYDNAELIIYGCEASENENPVFRYLPCETDSGEIGLWDDVAGTFEGSAGTGTFEAGPYGIAPAGDHNTNIGNVAREIESGTVLVGGVIREIESGLALVGGVAREVEFVAEQSKCKVTITNNSSSSEVAKVQINGTTYAKTAAFEVEPGTACICTAKALTSNARSYIYVNDIAVKTGSGTTAISYTHTIETDIEISFAYTQNGGRVSITTL